MHLVLLEKLWEKTINSEDSQAPMTPAKKGHVTRSVYSENQYVEYQPGDLNVILSVPHGGRLRPASIPDRDAGVFVDGKEIYDHAFKEKNVEKLAVRQKSDIYTVQLSLLLADELQTLTGRRPHVIICQLHRAKMDANCDVQKATFRVPEAQAAWISYHDFIQEAKDAIVGPGLFLDIHGQMHPEEWVELGYTMSGAQLEARDYDTATSIDSLITRKSVDCEAVITGPDSLGTLLQGEGYPTVPSATIPGPGSGNYYTGGYNTLRHGSLDGGAWDAIQIECPKCVRSADSAPAFAAALAKVLHHYLNLYYS